MNTITTTAFTETILAIDLGKYKSVACLHVEDGEIPVRAPWAGPSAGRATTGPARRLAPAPDNPDKPRTTKDSPHRPPALRPGRPGGGCSSRPSPGEAEERAGGVPFCSPREENP
jgi:hypothetical protein